MVYPYTCLSIYMLCTCLSLHVSQLHDRIYLLIAKVWRHWHRIFSGMAFRSHAAAFDRREPVLNIRQSCAEFGRTGFALAELLGLREGRDSAGSFKAPDRFD